MSEAPTEKPADPSARRRLKLQEIRFCQLYLESQNGTQSVIGAGFDSKTRNSAGATANKLLNDPAITAYLDRLEREALHAAQLTVNRIARALGRIALADRGRLYDANGRLLPPDQWPVDVAATVETVETEEVLEVVSEKDEPERKELRGYVRKVRTARRADALRLLAQWLKMIGPVRAADPRDEPGPLVIGGEADPSRL